MPNNFESAPEAEPKKEKLADFHLEVGDHIYDTTGKFYEVRKIVTVTMRDGLERGTLVLQQYDTGKPIGSEFDMSIKHFLNWQGNITYIDQPRLPEEKTLEDYAQSGRLKAAFTNIETTLNDPTIEQAEVDRLNVAKADLIREILASDEQDEQTIAE